VRGEARPARAGLRPAATGQHGGGGDDCAGDRCGRGSTAVAVAGAAGPPGGGGRRWGGSGQGIQRRGEDANETVPPGLCG
jgi:hypothetical protein